eukprot:gene1400-7944_t
MKRDRKPSRVENEDDAFVLPPSSEQNLKKDVDGIAPGTLQGLDKAFRAVSSDRKRLEIEGLSSHSFTLGVINITLSGAFPESFWVWNTTKASVIVIYQIVRWIPHKKAYYALDFCWIMSLLFLLWGLLQLFGIFPKTYETRIFLIMFTISTGPLAWSVPALQNKLVFHSIEYSSSLFIHLSPAISMWGLRWFGDRAQNHFPGRLWFLHDIEDMYPTTELILSYPIALYAAWWIPYTMWLLKKGIYLPDKGFDTVFDFNRRKMGIDRVFFLKKLSLPHLDQSCFGRSFVGNPSGCIQRFWHYALLPLPCKEHPTTIIGLVKVLRPLAVKKRYLLASEVWFPSGYSGKPE